jgi:hypothetical protein
MDVHLAVDGDPVDLARCCEADDFGVVVGENGTGHLEVEYIYVVAFAQSTLGIARPSRSLGFTGCKACILQARSVEQFGGICPLEGWEII